MSTGTFVIYLLRGTRSTSRIRRAGLHHRSRYELLFAQDLFGFLIARILPSQSLQNSQNQVQNVRSCLSIPVAGRLHEIHGLRFIRLDNGYFRIFSKLFLVRASFATRAPFLSGCFQIDIRKIRHGPHMPIGYSSCSCCEMLRPETSSVFLMFIHCTKHDLFELNQFCILVI